MPNSVLKNETLATSPTSFHAFSFLGSRGDGTQSTSEVFDHSTSVVFYTLINKNSVGCWNTLKPFTTENQGIIANDSELLVFPNDLTVDKNGNLFILSNRMPVYMFSALKPETNYRIMMGSTRELIKGTPCEPWNGFLSRNKRFRRWIEKSSFQIAVEVISLYFHTFQTCVDDDDDSAFWRLFSEKNTKRSEWASELQTLSALFGTKWACEGCRCLRM